ncbi:hypothetical protein HanIR_Chr04g0184041 [Helianthus annuus]|nr:hypothetical protein HanIR_Chr04g0184041 [Helianthus annuus]
MMCALISYFLVIPICPLEIKDITQTNLTMRNWFLKQYPRFFLVFLQMSQHFDQHSHFESAKRTQLIINKSS